MWINHATGALLTRVLDRVCVLDSILGCWFVWLSNVLAFCKRVLLCTTQLEQSSLVERQSVRGDIVHLEEETEGTS